MSNLRPTVDIIFKKLYAKNRNKRFTIALINNIVSPSDQVTSLEILNPYSSRNSSIDKQLIFDIKARCKTSGTLFNIEMQLKGEKGYGKRILAYWSACYRDQLRDGQKYDNMNKVIGIHFIKFDMGDSGKVHRTLRIREDTTGVQELTEFEVHLIDLALFKKIHHQTTKIEGPLSLEHWLLFFTRSLKELKAEDFPLTVREAMNELSSMHLTKKERMVYEDRLQYDLKAEGKIVEKRVKTPDEIKEERLDLAKELISKGYETRRISRILRIPEIELEGTTQTGGSGDGIPPERKKSDGK